MAVTSLLGKQGIAFGGHDKTDSALNLGNFLEVMKLLETFDYVTADSTVKERLLELVNLKGFNAVNH